MGPGFFLGARAAAGAHAGGRRRAVFGCRACRNASCPYHGPVASGRRRSRTRGPAAAPGWLPLTVLNFCAAAAVLSYAPHFFTLACQSRGLRARRVPVDQDHEAAAARGRLRSCAGDATPVRSPRRACSVRALRRGRFRFALAYLSAGSPRGRRLASMHVSTIGAGCAVARDRIGPIAPALRRACWARGAASLA